MAGYGRKNIDDALVVALAAGGSISFAANEAGCSESTVRRRLADPTLRFAFAGLLQPPPVSAPARASQRTARPYPLWPAMGKIAPGGSA